jgi:hypothetical protein
MPDTGEREVYCHCDGRRIPSSECNRCEQGYDSDDYDYDNPPLYRDGQLEAMDEAALQREWGRQCNIHDRGVDNLPMGHPTIEDAAARIKCIESQQKRRGFKTGPSEAWWTEG